MDCHFLTLAIFCILCSSTVSALCRNGWVSFENSCYLFSHSTSTWGEAEATCVALHSHLATVMTAEELNFLKSELNHLHPTDSHQKQYWIDGEDLEVENVWNWANSGDKLAFIQWAPGEPNNAQSGNCMNLWGTGGFDMADDDCERKLNYICKALNGGEPILIG